MSKHIHAECVALSVWYKAAGGYSLTKKNSCVNFIQNKKDGKDKIWQVMRQVVAGMSRIALWKKTKNTTK